MTGCEVFICLKIQSKRYLPCINAYFMAEMRGGILVAVADYQSFDGNLKRDVIDEE